MSNNKSSRTPRTTFRAGSVRYRTQPTSRQQAERFAHMLRFNLRFAHVEVLPCQRSDKYYVVYAPASPERQEALQQKAREEQRARSIDQSSDLTIVTVKYHADDVREAVIRNTKSGGEYTVSPYGSCTCPQFAIRLSKAGPAAEHRLGSNAPAATRVFCKHIEFVQQWAWAGEVTAR